jgi:hypothetical protein
MADQERDVKKVLKTAAEIEAGGIKVKQLAWATDALQGIWRVATSTYRRLAGIDAANIFTAANTFNSTVDVKDDVSISTDSKKLKVGASAGGEFYDDGTNVVLSKESESTAGDLIINGDSSNGGLMFKVNNVEYMRMWKDENAIYFSKDIVIPTAGRIYDASYGANIRINSSNITLSDELILSDVKSGATQVAAGAAAGEVWKTSGHATLPDNVLLHGV